MDNIFLKNIREKTDIRPGNKILVGVSGGMDSVILLYLFHKHSKELGIEIGVAHVNHLLRGKDSAKDQAFVKELAEGWGLTFHTIKIDVKKISKKNKWSIEEGARKLRYDYLNELKKLNGYDKIAVAHHHKDQAETILMHIIRGTGAEGLRGMFFDRAGIVRPLLNVTREDIEKKIKELQLEYRTDKSNLETKHARNKIRLKLLPKLKKYNLQIENNLVKMGEIIGEDDNFIKSEVERYYSQYRSLKDKQIIFGLELLELHPAIRRRLIIKAYKELSNKYLEYKYVLETDDYLKKSHNKKLGLPNGLTLYIKNNDIILDNRGSFLKEEEFEILIDKPGQYKIGDKTLNLEIITERIDKETYCVIGSCEGYLDFDKLTWPLLIRNRKAGDHFCVMGDKSSRKLKKNIY